MSFDGNLTALEEYLVHTERAELAYDRSYREALSDLQGETYFKVRLDDLIDLATPEEIVSFYGRSSDVQAIWSDDPNELEDGLTYLLEALEIKRKREGGLRIGTDNYVTEQGFRFIPSRIMPILQRIEAERRADA